MLGKRSFPFWPVMIAGVLIVGGAMTCKQRIGEAINDASLWTDATGRPMDAAGNGYKCPDCFDDQGGTLWWQRGYWFKCNKCGAEIQVRYHSENGQVEFAR